MPEHTNRLIGETSPYLLQHAHNPVDWYPWGEEALARAKAENRPILLSVGYSACHWCHVMERESFENEAIASLMNQYYVCIKVDREERPDIDAIYMNAVQALTGQGGWPMTVFLTPEGSPFYGGTYFPPDDRYGRPGFPRVLDQIASAWKNHRLELLHESEEILTHLKQSSDYLTGLSAAPLVSSLLDNAFASLSSHFDSINGGFGTAPKFPQPVNLDFLLRYAKRSGRQEPLAMVERTLQRMALGGLYDQLGGGFHRYSTDAVWLAPHFEKMLYDNAQLALTYARCWQFTGRPFYRGIAEETLEYVLREMTGPEGGFYSAQDADSEGEEGKFFVWTPKEIRKVIGEQAASIFCDFYDVTDEGNWEGMSILHVTRDVAELALMYKLSKDEIAQTLDTNRSTLFAARSERIAPGLDDKVLTSWNGLMLEAFAECGACFENRDFLEAARRNARFILESLSWRDAEGRLRLRRTWRNGSAALNGYLEDYAFAGRGFYALWEVTGEAEWLNTSRELTETVLTLFSAGEGEGFYTTSSDHEELIHRLKDLDDNAVPSGNSVMADLLLKLGRLLGEPRYLLPAESLLRRCASVLEKHPYGFARMLSAVDQQLTVPVEIAILGNPEAEETKSLLSEVTKRYLPNRMLAIQNPEREKLEIPLLRDREMIGGKPTAYVCENLACQLPVTEPEALEKQLQAR